MNDTSENKLAERVRAVVRNTFRLSAAQAAGDLRIGAPPQWDSIGHMQLLLEIENEFGLRFPTHTIASLTSIDFIVHAIKMRSEQASD
jgi:acyl carrier protein